MSEPFVKVDLYGLRQEEAEAKYPVEKARDSAAKYDRL